MAFRDWAVETGRLTPGKPIAEHGLSGHRTDRSEP